MTLDEAKQILNVADLNDLEAIQVNWSKGMHADWAEYS
jgi:hypothetical protein